jgi:hypothetical protein
MRDKREYRIRERSSDFGVEVARVERGKDDEEKVLDESPRVRIPPSLVQVLQLRRHTWLAVNHTGTHNAQRTTQLHTSSLVVTPQMERKLWKAASPPTDRNTSPQYPHSTTLDWGGGERKNVSLGAPLVVQGEEGKGTRRGWGM